MPDIETYVDDVVTRQSDLQRRMHRETMAVPHGGMQTGPDQAAFLSFLVKLTGAKRAIEVGVFRGVRLARYCERLAAGRKTHRVRCERRVHPRCACLLEGSRR